MSCLRQYRETLSSRAAQSPLAANSIHRFARSLQHPERLFHGDFDGDGVVDLIEAYDNPILQKTVPRRQLLRSNIAALITRDAPMTHAAFSKLGVDELPGTPHDARLKEVFANTLEHFGPIQEVQASSGYRSQNSLTQILATPDSAAELWVRWPGGRTTLSVIPAGAREIDLEPSGQVRVAK